MIINFQNKKSKPFENLVPNHRDEILRYFDIENKRIIETDVKVASGSLPVPSKLHLSNLIQLTIVNRTKSETGLPGNTYDVHVGLYYKDKLYTPIVKNVILDDPDNIRPGLALSADVHNYKIDYRNYEHLPPDKQTEIMNLFLNLSYGLTINVKKSKGFTNVVIHSDLTDTIITDRTFKTFD